MLTYFDIPSRSLVDVMKWSDLYATADVLVSDSPARPLVKATMAIKLYRVDVCGMEPSLIVPPQRVVAEFLRHVPHILPDRIMLLPPIDHGYDVAFANHGISMLTEGGRMVCVMMPRTSAEIMASIKTDAGLKCITQKLKVLRSGKKQDTMALIVERRSAAN